MTLDIKFAVCYLSLVKRGYLRITLFARNVHQCIDIDVLRLTTNFEGIPEIKIVGITCFVMFIQI